MAFWLLPDTPAMQFRCFVLLFLFALHPSVSNAHSRSKNTSGAGVVRELNLARQHPAVYAGFLEKLRYSFNGNICTGPGGFTFHTSEGVDAVNEAIRFLRNARPIAPLTISAGLSKAAAEHVAEQASGALGHSGPDHSSPADRISRHGIWRGSWGESIAYGESNARDIVVALIIDDGIHGRGHRHNIFNPAFNYAGVALGPHARYRTVCSIDFAGGFAENTSALSSFAARN